MLTAGAVRRRITLAIIFSPIGSRSQKSQLICMKLNIYQLCRITRHPVCNACCYSCLQFTIEMSGIMSLKVWMGHYAQKQDTVIHWYTENIQQPPRILYTVKKHLKGIPHEVSWENIQSTKCSAQACGYFEEVIILRQYWFCCKKDFYSSYINPSLSIFLQWLFFILLV